MPRIKDTTDAQTSFLRAFRTHPEGPPTELWPSPAILRRWLRQKKFQKAFRSLHQGLNALADLQLAVAAASAVRRLNASANPGSTADTRSATQLLRVAHLRQRFPVKVNLDAPTKNKKFRPDPERYLDLKDDAAFAEEAEAREYSPPLAGHPDFPAPEPQDTLYYRIIQDPAMLLHYLARYNEQTDDHRYASLLKLCKDIIPRGWYARFPEILPPSESSSASFGSDPASETWQLWVQRGYDAGAQLPAPIGGRVIPVRPANPSDAPTIVDFQLLMALETENLELDRPTVTQGVAAIFNHPEKGRYWIAEADNRIAGSMLTVPEWSDWRNGTVLWIHSVFVKEEFRRQGIFRAMYAHLKRIVEASSDLKGLRLYVHGQNQTAQSTYKNLGMDGEHYRVFEWMK